LARPAWPAGWFAPPTPTASKPLSLAFLQTWDLLPSFHRGYGTHGFTGTATVHSGPHLHKCERSRYHPASGLCRDPVFDLAHQPLIRLALTGLVASSLRQQRANLAPRCPYGLPLFSGGLTTTATIGVARQDSLPSERDRKTLVAHYYLHLLEPDWPSVPSSASQLYNTILACLPASSPGLAKYLLGLRRPAPGGNPVDTRLGHPAAGPVYWYLPGRPQGPYWDGLSRRLALGVPAQPLTPLHSPRSRSRCTPLQALTHPMTAAHGDSD
jgi:hypothetical protein